MANIQNVIDVFSFMNKVIEYYGEKEYEEDLIQWKRRYYRIWRSNIDNSKLKIWEKEVLKNVLDCQFCPDYEDEDEFIQQDNFFYQLNTEFHPYIEEYVSAISDKKNIIISFDIFDTLILRPLYKPEDLFVLMNDYVRTILGVYLEVNFAEMRKYSEQKCRERKKACDNYDEVTLDEIYDELQTEYNISFEHIKAIKEYEIGLEIDLCKCRNFGKYLFELAKYLGKKIILISDMYLPTVVLRKMLNKCGYSDNEIPIFVSSDCRLTKYNGDLYKHALNILGIKPKDVLHIGDNYHSDYEMAIKNGLKAIQIPKTIEAFATTEKNRINSNFFSCCMSDNTHLMSESSSFFLSTRVAYAVVANKMFDMPFTQIDSNKMNFNGNPYILGYAFMGPMLLGISHWLYKNASSEKYDCIHFIARDGYLFYQAFELLQHYFGEKKFKLNYMRTSRKAMIPLMIVNENDFINLNVALNYQKQSPQKLVSLLSPVIIDINEAKKIIKNSGLIWDKQFKNLSEYNRFILLAKTRLFDEKKNEEYRNSMKEYFSSFIGVHDCTFDVGYSGRTESILKLLTGISLDAYYVNTTTQIGKDNANANKFKLTSFYDYVPLLCGPVREMLMSEQGPSCISFKRANDIVYPSFEEYKPNFINEYIMKEYQKGSLDFIKDYISSLGDKMQNISFREHDLTWLMEYFIMHANKYDLAPFSNIQFEDDLFLGKTQNIVDYWINNQPQFSNIIVNDDASKSLSYKLGLAITYIPRKIYHCLHG